jgi:hypothetical protein
MEIDHVALQESIVGFGDHPCDTARSGCARHRHRTAAIHRHAAATEWKLGVDAEGKSLESIADPLSS